MEGPVDRTLVCLRSVVLRVRLCHVFGHVLEEGGHMDLSDQRADCLLAELASAQNVPESAPKVFAKQTVYT